MPSDPILRFPPFEIDLAGAGTGDLEAARSLLGEEGA